MIAIRKLQALALWFDDRVNPVLLKELRQAVRGRVVSGSLTFFILVSGLIMVIALINAIDQGDQYMDARDLIGPLFGILQFTALGIIPISVGMRLAGERSVNNTDLMFVSTLSPTRIVTGKFLAGALVALLIYSACLPFMTLAYLFRGMDIPTIVLNLIIGFHLVMIGISLGILTAAATTHRFLRVFLAMGFLAVLFILGSISGAFFEELLWSGDAGLILEDPTVLFQYLCFSFLTLWIVLGITLFSIAALESPSANRLFWIRIYALHSVLIFLGVIPLLMNIFPQFEVAPYMSLDEYAGVALFLAALSIGLLIVIACNERDRYGQRLRQEIPRSPVLRFFAFLTYSGAAGGLAFSLLLAFLTVILALIWLSVGTTVRAEIEGPVTFFMAVIAYALIYGLAGRMMQKLFQSSNATPDQSWVFSLAIMAVLTVLPMLTAALFLIRMDDVFDSPWVVFNPFLSVRALDHQKFPQFPLLIVLGIGSLLCALPWLIAQIQGFERLRRSSQHASQPDEAPAT